MKLYNCYSEEEKYLQCIHLDITPTNELFELAGRIKIQYDDQVLQDEIIIIDAMHQITMELGKRWTTNKQTERGKDKWKK